MEWGDVAHSLFGISQDDVHESSSGKGPERSRGAEPVDPVQIKLLRETLNLVELALAIFPNGLADYKVPADRALRDR
jgi:hypothetical protein